MDINFSCINMEHSTYLRNYVENKLHEKIFLLICPPLEADITIRADQDMKYVSCEVLTLDSALFYIEFANPDVHQAIDDVIDRVVLLLNGHEARLRSLRDEYSENVIDLNARRRNSHRGYTRHR